MSDALSAAHFDAIAGRYARSERTLKPLYDAARAHLDRAVEGRQVLDVGNGGMFPYERSRARSVTVLDLSARMLERVPEGVAKVLGDARRMDAFADASFDAVLFNLSLHHIDDGRAEALAEAWRVLRPGGELLVYEPVLAPSLAGLQRGVAPMTRALLRRLGKPMVLFETRRSLTLLLDRACPGSETRVIPAEVTGWSDPLGGTFPGLMMLPTRLFPTRFELFVARKPRG